MKKYDFAFIVHSRDRTDLPRKYPILRYVPNIVFDWITLNLFPIIVSNISGASVWSTGKNDFEHARDTNSRAPAVVPEHLSGRPVTCDSGMAFHSVLEMHRGR
jgi:hypothetical protein